MYFSEILFYQILSSVKKFVLKRPPKFQKVGVVCQFLLAVGGRVYRDGLIHTHPNKQIVDPLIPDTQWGWYSYLHYTVIP